MFWIVSLPFQAWVTRYLPMGSRPSAKTMRLAKGLWTLNYREDSRPLLTSAASSKHSFRMLLDPLYIEFFSLLYSFEYFSKTKICSVLLSV
jgi:hypothetical protein